jgi:hypothetical protein
MSKFQEVLVEDVNDIISLPLLHTCDAFSLRGILENMALIPQHCDVFSLELLYTYYGIPSYRSNYNLATLNPAFHMICIILDSEKVKEFYKVFPFDSGAFEKLPTMKETFFHPKNKIIDFELENTLDSPKRIIKTFYETNDNYLKQKPQVTKKFSQFDFEAISYENLISQNINNILDDRTSSIEVIFNQTVSLSKETVKQIIIPNVFKDDAKISDLIFNNFGINEPIGYDTFKGSPKENFGLIRSEYFKFLKN